MRFLDCDEKYNRGVCSDFEFFAEWERILPECAGSVSASLYQKQLSLLEISPFDEDGIRLSPKELWNVGNEKMTEEEMCYFTRKYREMIEKQGIDVFEFITNIANSYRNDLWEEAPSWESLSQMLCSRLEPAASLRLSVLQTTCVRPDRYHATLFWQALCRGEKLNREEEFVLSFQLLIEALLYLKKAKVHATVHLDLRDGSTGIPVVSYLKDNRLIEGEVRFPLRLGTPLSDLLSLCRLSEEGLRVLPELVLSPSDLGAPLSLALREIATVYPIGGLRFGRVLSDAPSLELAARGEAYERIEAFLTAENVCDEKRQKILENIFNS